MKYDDLLLHFRPQPYYEEADAYQVAVRRSTVSYLGGAWLRRPAGQSPGENRLTPAWCQAMRDRYRRHVERYWQAAENDGAAFLASSARVSQRQVAALGQEMFEALPWSVQEALRAGLRCARRRGRGLRVILEFAEDESARQVAGLPWELLYDPAADNFLALSGSFSLVRSVPRTLPPDQVSVRRVLAVVANPQGLPVPLDQEMEDLRQAAESVQGQLTLETVTGSDTLGQMRRYLAAGNLEGLILVAHGELGDGLGHSLLLLADDQDNIQRVDERFLRSLFNDAPGLQFVALSVCHSAAAPPEAASSAPQKATLAELLVRDGVPAVVAMQDQMSIRANRHLLRALVDGLAGGCSMEEALRRGRKAVHQSLFDPIHWSVPVLYVPAEPSQELPWYARLADVLAEWFWRPEAGRALSGTLAVALIWTLINLVVGAGTTRPWPPLELSPIQGWLLLSWLLLSPGLIAVLHRPRHPRVLQLNRTTQLVYKLQGANVGMMVGAFSALLALSLVYYSPLWPLLPEPAVQLLLALGLGWSVAMSYSQARAIPRVMTVNAHVRSPRLSGNDLPVALFWPLVLLVLLLGGWLLGNWWARPALGSAIMAGILLALVVALRREEVG
jgi:hypothetical protein